MEGGEAWVPHRPETWPARYGELKKDVNGAKYLGYWEGGQPAMEEGVISKGTTVKIVMVSRFGDVGITDELSAWRNYKARVSLDDLADLRSEVKP